MKPHVIKNTHETAELINLWPELIPLDEPELPALDPGSLPSWAGEFATALAASTETPPELALAMVLAACSTACARRLRVCVGPDYFEPTNLWLLCALPPGNRKSAVQAAAVAPILDWEREQAEAAAPEVTRITSDVETMRTRAREFRNKAAKAEDEIDAMGFAEQARRIEASIPEVPRVPQLWTSDATPEHLGTLMANNSERMAWLSSEGGIFDMLGGRYSNGVPNLDLVLKAHSGDADRVDRGSRPPIFLRQPLLAIGLSPQPDVLQGLARRPGFRGRGLLARFCYLMPRSNLGYRRHDAAPIPPALREAYSANLRAMLSWPLDTDADGNPAMHIISLTAEARADLLAFARHVEREMLPGAPFEHATDWAGKLPGMAARIAGVLHGIEHAHGAPWSIPIPASTMEAALELAALMMKHALAALALMGADSSVEAARRVWGWVKRNRHAVFTAREAHRALQASFPRMSDLMPAIEMLEERGYVLIEKVEAQGKGRPPSPAIRVRPDIAEGWR